jgi:N-acetylmuramic acid 6-phosphate etherase
MPRPASVRSLLLWVAAMTATAYATAVAAEPSVTALLGITPSDESRDYVAGKGQFQLHTLLTEQRHPETMDLSRRIGGDTVAGLQALFAVDRDVARTMTAVADDPARLQQLQRASESMQRALRDGHRLYFYGTGSTGRLAETLESGLWRPFWQRAATQASWAKVEQALPGIADRVRGEITGGDRALISSLEGFEDLQLIGRLQLQDHGIGPGDVVFAVTEGGETSAVIGTALRGAEVNGNDPSRTWFVYNNPDDVLLPFERSRRVIEDQGIAKINLATGPQSITGSTRMQATTTSLYALGVVMEHAIHALLAPLLDANELRALGFAQAPDLAARLRDFATLQAAVASTAPPLSAWTDLESGAYAAGRRATYLAQRALMPVFVDVTERAPTFRLAPLDRTDAAERRSWIQVWTPTRDPAAAWQALLQRPFHGLDPALYEAPFSNEIDDPYLRRSALRSLALAGAEQQHLYDLAYSEDNMRRAGPGAGDVGALILLGEESPDALGLDWLRAFDDADAATVVVRVSRSSLPDTTAQALDAASPGTRVLQLTLPGEDPLELNQVIALKMLLNAHSTGIMAKLGRVVGNTMTAVQPGNLKLIGRATYLIQSHVNAVLDSEAWVRAHGAQAPLSYADANAVLFDVIEQRRARPALAASPEVELSIVRILESLRLGRAIGWDDALALLRERRLDDYLASYD